MPPSTPVLVSLALLVLNWTAARAAEMTVDPRSSVYATYPQLISPGGASRYYRLPQQDTVGFSPGSSRTEFDAFLSRLEPIDRPTPVAGYIEIVTISGQERFVFQHFPEQLWQPSGGGSVYRVTPRAIDAVITWDKHGTLAPGPEVTRWSYDYDASGRLLLSSEWCALINQGPAQELYTQRTSGVWSESLMSRLLLPPPRHEIFHQHGTVADTLPAAWAGACALRRITVYLPRAVASSAPASSEASPASP